MRSPWIDLLLLHGHALPAALTWRCDQAECKIAPQRREVDVAQLPLQRDVAHECRCHA